AAAVPPDPARHRRPPASPRGRSRGRGRLSGRGRDWRGAVKAPVIAAVALGSLVLAAGAACTDRDPAHYHASIPPLPPAQAAEAGPPVPVPPGTPPSLAHGAELYLENCAACHSSTGIGGTLSAAQRSGAPDTGGPETFAPPVTSSSREEVAEAIRVGPGTMPV